MVGKPLRGCQGCRDDARSSQSRPSRDRASCSQVSGETSVKGRYDSKESKTNRKATVHSVQETQKHGPRLVEMSKKHTELVGHSKTQSSTERGTWVRAVPRCGSENSQTASTRPREVVYEAGPDRICSLGGRRSIAILIRRHGRYVWRKRKYATASETDETGEQGEKEGGRRRAGGWQASRERRGWGGSGVRKRAG